MKTAPFREGVPYAFTKSFLMNQKTHLQIYSFGPSCHKIVLRLWKYKYLNMNLLFGLLLPLWYWVSSEWFFHIPLWILSPLFSTPLSCPWKLIWVDCNRFLQALVGFNPREPRGKKGEKFKEFSPIASLLWVCPVSLLQMIVSSQHWSLHCV